MSDTKERFVGALVGAYTEAMSWRSKDTGVFPPLASEEDLERRRLELLAERLESYVLFTEELIKKPKDNPRYFALQVATPLIPHIVTAALLFVRKPDLRSRFIRRLYWDKSEDSQDFALVFATTLSELVGGADPRVAVDFARRFHLGGGVFSDLESQTTWIMRAACGTFDLNSTDGSGYTGALLGAHDPEYMCAGFPEARVQMGSLAVRLYDLSQ